MKLLTMLLVIALATSDSGAYIGETDLLYHETRLLLTAEAMRSSQDEGTRNLLWNTFKTFYTHYTSAFVEIDKDRELWNMGLKSFNEVHSEAPSPMLSTKIPSMLQPPYSRDVNYLIEKYSGHYGIEPKLVYAIIGVESDWNVKAVSRKGALGLMQIMPMTFEEMLGPGYIGSEIMKPELNINAGVKYLRYLHDRYENDLTRVLIGYNAGPKYADRYPNVRLPKETRRYIKKINRRLIHQ